MTAARARRGSSGRHLKKSGRLVAQSGTTASGNSMLRDRHGGPYDLSAECVIVIGRDRGAACDLESGLAGS